MRNLVHRIHSSEQHVANLVPGRKILDTTNPMGATSGFKVGIATPVPIDITLVTAGAVNSWLAGNYNYDLSDAYPDVSKGELSGTDAASLAKLSVTQDTAGFFNLPVCKVLDLRSFPNAAAGTGYANSEWASPNPFLLSTIPIDGPLPDVLDLSP